MKNAKIASRQAVARDIEGLTPEYIESSNWGIRDNFLSLPEFLRASTIFAYLSIKREPATMEIINAAFSMGKTVALPISLAGGIMEAHIINSLDGLVPGKLGILEPPRSSAILAADEIDIIIVPGITFDSNGYRIGHGGGYYDRFLAKTSAYSVGLCREALIREVPTDHYDMPVNCLVTERCALHLR